MNTGSFLTYQKFSNKNEAIELVELLEANKIEYVFEESSAPFDPTFSNSEINREFRIKLRKEDFEKADKLLLDISAVQIKDVDKDYYLFEFSDSELVEVIAKSDEWSKFDYQLAQKILKDRGQEINDKLLESLRKHRIEELTKPEQSQNTWITAGYIFSFLGGLLGLFIGWHLLYHKKTLPNGDRVYGYSNDDRRDGKRIFFTGIIFFIIWIVVRILIST